MRRAYVWLAAGLWFFGTMACRADEPAAPVKPLAAPVCSEGNGCSCWAGCKAFRQRFCDWLLYQPLKQPAECGCHSCLKTPLCCRPPLYVYFLGNCGLAHGGCGSAVVTWEEPSRKSLALSYTPPVFHLPSTQKDAKATAEAESMAAAKASK